MILECYSRTGHRREASGLILAWVAGGAVRLRREHGWPDRLPARRRRCLETWPGRSVMGIYLGNLASGARPEPRFAIVRAGRQPGFRWGCFAAKARAHADELRPDSRVTLCSETLG